METNKSIEQFVSVDFVGDSMIERWDLSDYFETWHTRNFGKSGAGIDYLEMLQGRFVNRRIVVIIGINDSIYFSEQELDGYVARYIDAIRGLGADKIYLFSVLPCNFNRNDEIESFNSAVKQRIKPYDDMVYIDAYPEFISREPFADSYIATAFI